MGKENQTPETVETLQAQVNALQEQLALVAGDSAKVVQLEAENSELKAKIEALEQDLGKIGKNNKVVPGVYKSKAHNKTIRFKDGILKTRVNGELIDSAVVIKNEKGIYTELLDSFIKVGAAVIEEVK